MTHGIGSEGSKADPNLTPLLDVVLQLLMFFMMCVNFVSEQVNESIRLPVSQSARPMDKSEVAVLFLNVDQYGNLIVPGQDSLNSRDKIAYYLRQTYADAERTDKLAGGKGDVKTAIVIRADRNSTYRQVYDVLQVCKQVGYRKLHVRALSKAE